MDVVFYYFNVAFTQILIWVNQVEINELHKD